MICGSVVALAIRVSLATVSTGGIVATLWPLRVVVAVGAVVVGVAALRGSDRDMRFFGATGRDILQGMQRMPLCGLPPAGIWALLGSYRHGNARDVPVESLALFAHMPTVRSCQ
jgi:hypothetical protein